MGSCHHVDNRRQARRYRTQHVAKIVLGPECMISCMVKDISTSGARIALAQPMDLPDDFDLFIAAHDLQVHRARLRWRQNGSLGVSFDQTTDRSEQAHALLDGLAQGRGSFEDEFERLRVEVEREPAEPQVFTRRISA
jgi:PilZ domain